MNTGPIFQVKHSQLAKYSIWFITKNLSNKSRYNTSLLFYHKKCKKKNNNNLCTLQTIKYQCQQQVCPTKG